MRAMFLVGLLGILSCNGCKTSCDAQKIIEDHLPSLIAKALNCSGIGQIEMDVNSTLEKFNVCKAKKAKDVQGGIASILCPPVIGGLISIAGHKIPSYWKCNAGTAEKSLEVLLTPLCEMLPF